MRERFSPFALTVLYLFIINRIRVQKPVYFTKNIDPIQDLIISKATLWSYVL